MATISTGIATSRATLQVAALPRAVHARPVMAQRDSATCAIAPGHALVQARSHHEFDRNSTHSLRAIPLRPEVYGIFPLLVVIQRCFFDQGTHYPVDLLVRERVVVILGQADDGIGLRPTLEQSKLPDSQHAAIVGDLAEQAL